MRTSRKPTVIAVFVTAILASLAVGGALASAIPDGGEQLTACVRENNGQMRLVESADDCRDREYPVAWNQMGVPGPEGPAGPAGMTAAYETNSMGGLFEPGDPPVDGYMVQDLPAGDYVFFNRWSTWLADESPLAQVGCDLFEEAADGSRVYKQGFIGGSNDEAVPRENQSHLYTYSDHPADTRLVVVCEHTSGGALEMYATWTAIPVDDVEFGPTPWPN